MKCEPVYCKGTVPTIKLEIIVVSMINSATASRIFTQYHDSPQFGRTKMAHGFVA